MIAEILISGLILGGLYALLSLGFALINGVARVFNLAHGTLYLLCAYYIYSLYPYLGLELAIIVSLVLIVITALIFYQIFIHPLRKKGFSATVVTLAVAIFFQSAISLIWGPQYIAVPMLVAGYTTVLGVRVVNQKLLSLIVAIILVAFLGWFINKTRVGKSIKAVAQNMDVARLVGINIRNTFMISMGISALLAGFAAVLYVPRFPVYPDSWIMLFSVFPVLVLGGLGSLKGALVGAFIMAFTERIIEFTIQGGYFVQTATFAVMLIIIFIKPAGIFGKKRDK